jgi:ABC-type transport system substrate-binding protein
LKTSKVLILPLIIIFALSGCGREERQGGGDGADTVSKLTVGAYSFANQNPLALKSGYNEPVNLLIYDSLFNIDGNFDAVPCLAKDITVENGGISALVALNPNVKFHDGSLLTARDVEATINYITENGGYFGYNVRNIANVSVVNDYTVKINYKYAAPNPAHRLTFPILCRNQLVSDTNFTINGTGPYKISYETKGKQIELSKNADYHSPFNSGIKEIDVNMIPDKYTARSLSSSGILDVFYSAFYDGDLKTVTKSETNNTDYATDEYTFITFNPENRLLESRQLRKAISNAIDREKAVNEIYVKHADAAYYPLPPSSWALPANAGLKRDVAGSKKLLSDAGYGSPDSNGILKDLDGISLEFSLLCANTTVKKSLAESISANLKEAGIAAEVKTVEPERFSGEYQTGKYDLCLMSSNVGYDMDLFEFLDPVGKFYFPSNIEYSSHRDKLTYTDNRELKQPIYSRICNEFYEEMPHVPILFLKNTLAISKKTGEFSEPYPINLFYKIITR